MVGTSYKLAPAGGMNFVNWARATSSRQRGWCMNFVNWAQAASLRQRGETTLTKD